jgi:hypothetical protein
MPDVGFDKKPVRYELKTAPPDGFVELRRLPYDEILARREMATKLSMEQSTQRRGRRQKQDERQKIDIELIQLATREYEFASCIVNHNLEIDGVPVDFSKPKLAFKMVAPPVLQEIELYLSELNQETDEDGLEDFLRSAKPSSSSESTLPQSSTETG